MRSMSITNRMSIQIPKKPKLLFVGAFPPSNRNIYGGNVTACKNLMQSSFPKRVELILIDSTQISNPAPPFFIRLFFAARRMLVFIYRFEHRKPEAVLLFTGSGAGFVEKGLMAWYTTLRNRKAFLFPRGGGLLNAYSRSGSVPKWVKILFRPSIKVFCQGETWRNFVLKGLGRQDADASVIPNWAATQQLLIIGEKRSVSVHAKPLRLLFVGWVEREKGIKELLTAFDNIARSYDVTLNIVGQGRLFAFVETFIKERGHCKIVKLSGWLIGNELEDAFRNSDVFVLPSWVEGLPNAMIEAMATGLCIVATQVGNIPDVIVDGENGFLVPPQDIDALVRTLQKVICDEKLRYRVSQKAHETAKQTFSVEKAVDKLIEEMFAESTVHQ